MEVLLILMALLGQPCQQWYIELPPWADPNMVDGILLPPVPSDPNIWELRPGTFVRELAMACDPDGDSFTIKPDWYKCTSTPKVTHDRVAGLWSFEAHLSPGINRFVFVADDGLVAQRFTVLVRVIGGRGPILMMAP